MNEQSAAKPLSSGEYGERSETIPQGSRELIPEIEGALTDNAEGNDIVRIKDINDFIKKANLKHNNKFDYSKFIYVKAKVKGIIICKEHGEFEQNPDKHLNSKYACPKCFYERPLKYSRRKREKQFYVTKEIFLERAIQKYGNRFEYDLNNYNGPTKNKIRIKCSIHDWFEQLPIVHLNKDTKNGCQECAKEARNLSKTKTYDFVISQFKKIHNNFYVYPELNREIYKNKKSIIKIVCPIHGEFEKKAQKHLIGQGCFRCRMNDLVKKEILVGGYSKDLFKEKPQLKDRKASIYYIKIGNNELYKIGITTNLKDRLKGLKHKSKNSIELLLYKKSSLYECFILEQKILKENKKFRTFKHEWSKELFDLNIINKIRKYFY